LGKRNLKEKGAILELIFAAECMQRNLRVSKPIVGDTLPYDLLVDNKDRIFKVQLKVATRDKKYHRKFWINSHRKLPNSRANEPSSTAQPYQKGEIDVIVSNPQGVWFFFANCHSLPSCLTVYPSLPPDARKWNFGKEDWGLLGI